MLYIPTPTIWLRSPAHAHSDRPHSRLGWLTPAAYASTITIAAEAAATDLLPCFWTDLCWKIPV